MWETIRQVIEKIPSWYWMVSIPVYICISIWVFSHIRRDKHGKIYWYSQRYEDNKNKEKISTMEETIRLYFEQNGKQGE